MLKMLLIRSLLLASPLIVRRRLHHPMVSRPQRRNAVNPPKLMVI